MQRIEPFEKYIKEYDEWFIKNQNIYLAELKAVREVISCNGFGLDVGVGSGRFALPLGVQIGVDPSKKMADISKNRGIQVSQGIAEQLPFYDRTFDFALMITTICFLKDILQSLSEVYRILKNHGFIVVGFIDKKSKLGTLYQQKPYRSKFYRDAIFYSVNEVIRYLKKANFNDFLIKQTLFLGPPDVLETVENGYGKGSFVVIKAIKLENTRS